MWKIIDVWTDGACSGNPGPGGWAWATDKSNYQSGYVESTTNNQMELMAVYEAIKETESDCHLVIHTDSNGVIQWLTNGWRRSSPEILRMCEDIERLAHSRNISLGFVKVKGHSTDAMNGFVDLKAVQEYKSRK